MRMKKAQWALAVGLLFIGACSDSQEETVLEPIEWNATEQRLLFVTIDDALAFETSGLENTVKEMKFYLDVYEDGELNKEASQKLGGLSYDVEAPFTDEELFFAYEFKQVDEDDDIAIEFYVQSKDDNGYGEYKTSASIPYSSDVFQAHASANGLDTTTENTPLFLWAAGDELSSNWNTEEGLAELRGRGKTFAIIGVEWVRESLQ